MSAFANLTGKDWDGDITGATNAVTYTPTQIDQNGVAIWTKEGAVYDANQRISLSVKRPTKGSQVIRVQLKLVHPVMDAVDTTLKIGECLINVEAVFPKRSTAAQREKAWGNLVFIMNEEAQVASAISAFESVY